MSEWRDSLPDHVQVKDDWLVINDETLRLSPKNPEQVEIYGPSGFRLVALSTLGLGPIFLLKELADEGSEEDG